MLHGTETLYESTGEQSSQLTLFVEDSPVRTLAALDDAQASSLEASLASGENSLAALILSGHAMPSLRMSPVSSAAAMTSSPANVVRLAETSSLATWRPPSWRNVEPQQDSFAYLVDGIWTTGQRSFVTSRGWVAYSETWTLSGMMQNGNVYQRPPLVPRTSGIGPSLLPTPTASLGEATQGRGAETTNHDTVRRLREAGILPKREMFPTPMASEAGKSDKTLEMVLAGEFQMTLDRFVKLWPTPSVLDKDFIRTKNAQQRLDSGHQVMLSHAVNLPQMWPTPTASDGVGVKRILRSTETWEDTSSLPALIEGQALGLTGKERREKGFHREASSDSPALSSGQSGQLNPRWVEWLMMFPQGWTDLGASVIELASVLKLTIAQVGPALGELRMWGKVRKTEARRNGRSVYVVVTGAI